MFERLLAAIRKTPARRIEEDYRGSDELLGEESLRRSSGHLLICCEPRKTVDQIEQIIVRSELKLGRKPKVVLLDYVQLIAGKGQSRYDRASEVAEGLKAMAKATKTIVIIASQVGRPSKDKKTREVGLHDAKESGSLENSCGLVFGAWRDPDDRERITLRVMKATRGGAGLEVECNFNGESMVITERARMSQ